MIILVSVIGGLVMSKTIDERIKNEVYFLAMEIADAFGGDIDEHPQPDHTDQAEKNFKSLIVQAEKEARIDEAMLANRMAHASSGDLLFENIHNRLTQLRKE